MNLLAMLAPVIGRLLVWAWDRARNHLHSTAIGAAAGGAAIAFMETFGCDASLMNEAVIAGLVAVPSLLATDPKKVGETLLQAVQSAVEQKKHSNQVLADAQALQDQAAKDAGIGGK